ncbi:MAG: hypothetical protein ACR2QV_08815 [Gammaproteobacteria bacterium]
MKLSRFAIALPAALALSALFALAIIGIAAPAQAQQERDVIEVMKSQISTQRQALVAENLFLTKGESDAFWPLYREFQNERNPLIDRRIELLTQFRDNFDSLTEEQAADIIDGWVELESDIAKLRKQYVKKFRKILSEKTTLRYFQVENKLDTIIDYDLSQVTPLAE